MSQRQGLSAEQEPLGEGGKGRGDLRLGFQLLPTLGPPTRERNSGDERGSPHSLRPPRLGGPLGRRPRPPRKMERPRAWSPTRSGHPGAPPLGWA